MNWWDDTREDRFKKEEEFRPFEEGGWWYRITGKTLAKRCHHCPNTDGTHGQGREKPLGGGSRLKERGRDSLTQNNQGDGKGSQKDTDTWKTLSIPHTWGDGEGRYCPLGDKDVENV